MIQRTGKATETVFKLKGSLVEGEWNLVIPPGIRRIFRIKQESY